MRIRTATAAEVAPLVEEAFDARGVPWARRFPHVDLYVALEADGSLVSAAALRTLVWTDGLRVTAVGLVCTAPTARGAGHASALLREVPRPAVLWARRHDVFARAGWELSDTALSGRTSGDPDVPAIEGSPPAAVTALHGSGVRLERDARVFRALPPPARDLRAHLADDTYALVGRAGDTAFLYELGGDPSGFAAVWERVRAGVREVVVNAEAGTPAARWLAGHATKLAPQSLALWSEAPQRRHVPWLDRI